MKRIVKLGLVIYTLLLLAGCSGPSSESLLSSKKIETNSSGYYLKRTDNSCTLCYKHFDDEKLRKKAVGNIDSDTYFKYATSFISSDYYTKFATNYNDEIIEYTFDLCDFFTVRHYSGERKECIFFDISFYDDGHCLCYPLYKYKNPFTCFKLYSEQGHYYLKFSFFTTKKEKEFYGENYEKLTLDDIILESEEIYQYSSDEYNFVLVPLDKAPLIQQE